MLGQGRNDFYEAGNVRLPFVGKYTTVAHKSAFYEHRYMHMVGTCISTLYITKFVGT